MQTITNRNIYCKCPKWKCLQNHETADGLEKWQTLLYLISFHCADGSWAPLQFSM